MRSRSSLERPGGRVQRQVQGWVQGGSRIQLWGDSLVDRFIGYAKFFRGTARAHEVVFGGLPFSWSVFRFRAVSVELLFAPYTGDLVPPAVSLAHPGDQTTEGAQGRGALHTEAHNAVNTA